MANYWMHNGFLQVEGQKMSKSLGNLVTIDDVLKDWPGVVARFNMLKTHYRQPIDWTKSSLETTAHTLEDWWRAASKNSDAALDEPSPVVVAALSDDLNFSDVIAELHRLRKSIVQVGEGQNARLLTSTLAFLGVDLGLFGEWLNAENTRVFDHFKVKTLTEARLSARKAKNWAESDRIRDELAAMGIVIKDVKDPATGELKTEWEVKR
jgi:cysteinyl-tRNA synthetase